PRGGKTGSACRGARRSGAPGPPGHLALRRAGRARRHRRRSDPDACGHAGVLSQSPPQTAGRRGRHPFARGRDLPLLLRRLRRPSQADGLPVGRLLQEGRRQLLLKKLTAEALGTALLLAAVVGSGIMGEALARPNVALALLANTVATGAALVALIITFGPISGAHFNPVVTLADASQGGLPWREVPAYIAAQVGGAFLGVGVAHIMFKQPALFFASQHRRDGIAQLVAEFVATFGLLAVIWGSARRRPGLVPLP